MGKGILKGMIESKLIPADNITVYNRSIKSRDSISQAFGNNSASSAAEIAKIADIIIVGVKPNIIRYILRAIRDLIKPSAILVSIAAGVTIKTIELALKDGCKVVRVMPNIPSLVNEGMSSITPNKHVKKEETALISKIFRSFGKAEVIPEHIIHAVIAVSSSSPAYVFMLIEAMVDIAVLAGMSKSQSYLFAAQAVVGSAKMVLETGKHLSALKDMVCSLNGTTMEAVKVLEEKEFRATVMAAMQCCIKKSNNMSIE
ncbi:pyrroline-5-carboxylate reductase [Candidatus Profftia tarda]|nr:pyrroline-5-carboxylate reductase [Candidatus Profftia tarda]